MIGEVETEIQRRTGRRPVTVRTVSSSWGLTIVRADFADGLKAAVKLGPGQLAGHLELEAFMLQHLASRTALPVPRILDAQADFLMMEWVENDGPPRSEAHERHAGELIAALHQGPQHRFGYERDTVIGALPQPNAAMERWVPFFRDRRLLHFAYMAHRDGPMPTDMLKRLETLAGQLERYLDEPVKPALLHGDLWGGNVLARGDRIAAFVDPAIYAGHPEMDLAFATLFGTFSMPFFEAYGANAPFDAGFFEIRRDIYNIVPNLVHAVLFGPNYLGAVEGTLRKLGL